jgi:hypothetical protein
MKGASTGLCDSQYVRNVSCAGLSVLLIQKKNKSNLWSWVEVGIQIILFSGGSQSSHCIWR